MKQPSATQIKNILKSSAFDPRKPGPMAVILQSGSPEYLMERSVELIREALTSRSKVQNMKLAISLLAMAQTYYERPAEPKTKLPKSGIKDSDLVSDTPTP